MVSHPSRSSAMIASRTGIRLTPSWRAMSSWCTRSPWRSPPLKMSGRTCTATRSPLLGRSMSGTGAKPTSSSCFAATCIRYASQLIGLGPRLVALRDGAGGPQLGDLGVREPELPQHRVGVDARVGVGVARDGLGAAEPRRGRHLATTVGGGQEEVARDVVRVLVGLAEPVDG